MPFLQLWVHLTFVTHDREPLITAAAEQVLWPVIAGKARKLGCDSVVVGGMPDHVHVLTELPATISVAELARNLKGNAAHFFNRQVAPRRAFCWQVGYGAFTLRKSEAGQVARYIARQKEHHASGRLSSLLERTDGPERYERSRSSEPASGPCG